MKMTISASIHARWGHRVDGLIHTHAWKVGAKISGPVDPAKIYPADDLEKELTCRQDLSVSLRQGRVAPAPSSHGSVRGRSAQKPIDSSMNSLVNMSAAVRSSGTGSPAAAMSSITFWIRASSMLPTVPSGPLPCSPSSFIVATE